MSKYYTAGELAKIAGVSSRTIRFYDEKGILKPCGYSKEEYRLYDDSAIMTLQEILMLKYVGFSLEDIAGLIKQEEASSMDKMLEKQKELMLKKREQIDRIIYALDSAKRSCKEEALDLQHFAEIMQLITKNDFAGQRYGFYERFSTKQQEWFAWRFDSLSLQENMVILDVGCGHGIIWTLNWERIPTGCKIILLDKEKKGLDYLRGFWQENSHRLAEGVTFEWVEADAEALTYEEAHYDCILANHLWSYIKDKEGLMHKLKWALKPEGVLHSTISAMVKKEDTNAIVKPFLQKEIWGELNQKREREKAELEEKLQGIFGKMEKHCFGNELVIDDAESVYQYLCGADTNLKQLLERKREAFLKYLKKRLEEEKVLKIGTVSNLYICTK